MRLQKAASNALRNIHYPIYHHLFLWLSKVAIERTVSNLAATEGLRALSIGNLLSYKTSDTLFVLGSGSSINRLTPGQWRRIESHDTIGFNFWLLHDFLPDFYVLEPMEDEKASILGHNLQIRSSAYRKVPFILKDAARLPETSFLENLPPFVKRRLLVSKAVNIPGTTAAEFSRSIDMLRATEISRMRDTNLLFKMRASLSFILFLAHALGYRQIVLCGVDLNHSTYFFEENAAAYRNQGLRLPANVHKANLHRTADPALGQVTVDQAVYALKRRVFEPKGVQLYVGSKTSLLYPELPCYFE